jgi:integrase
MALTVKQVAKLTEPGRYADGHGLYLQVISPSNRSWLLRFERRGRERWMGLGPLHTFALDEARERARKARQLLADGVDPLDARNAERAKQATEAARAVAQGKTFEECAALFYKFHSPKWKNKKYRDQFMSALGRYAFPIIGRLPVAAIDRGLVLRVVEPIWGEKNTTANRIRGWIESVLDFAKVNEWRDGENPAAWTGNLKHALPAPGTVVSIQHHPALPFAEMPDFMAQLATCEGIAARALEFTILTAARNGETIGARWSEIDLKEKTWTILAARMKAKKDHRVPLCDRVIAILKALPRESDFVFLGKSKGRALGHSGMRQQLKRMQRADITVHGFRSTFRDWAAERTGYANHVIEMALAHTIGSAVEAAYRRGDLFEKRRKLMDAWTAFCMTPQRVATVTPIRAQV